VLKTVTSQGSARPGVRTAGQTSPTLSEMRLKTVTIRRSLCGPSETVKSDWTPLKFIRGDSAIPMSHAIRRLQAFLRDWPDVGMAGALLVLGPLADTIDRDVIVRHEEHGK
jgi:hypothetical protein